MFRGNEEFRQTDFVPNITYWKGIVSGQQPKILWIGCSDSRVNPERITGSAPGELFIQRNIGNAVPLQDWNFTTVLEYALMNLKVEHIVICGHSDCGAIKALDIEDSDYYYIPVWLNNAREAKHRVDSQMKKPVTPEEIHDRYQRIEKENVRLQLEHLKAHPLVKKVCRERRIFFHGLYFNIHDGRLTRIE
ncbi:MAG: carbonic anhydrase [Methanoregula sp.]|nr:MAG: carbonic anhydrase [Methanoregula sp.]